jgi:hypothetical protein
MSIDTWRAAGLAVLLFGISILVCGAAQAQDYKAAFALD